MSDEKKKPAEDDVDVRIDFMSIFVMKALRLKPDKWNKMIQGDEKEELQKFFEDPTIPMITFHINQAGLPQPYFGYCPSARSKVVYFVRNIDQVITHENVRLTLTVGELSNETINELTILTEEIFTPLLCNPKNHIGWPNVVIDDVKKQVYCFKNILYQIQGDLNSQVMLPMPAGVEKIYKAEQELIESNGETMDVYLKTNIEGVVIQWANQINNVLKEDSRVAFRKAQFPMPMADVNYWASRLKNLEGIYSQLRDVRMKKMAKYLEMTDSVYIQCFRSMLTNLVAGVVEARDVVLYQKPLIPHFEIFMNTDFTESKSLIRPMLHCIGLLWGNSQYYCTTDKITVLLEEVCNMMIEKCTNACDPSTIFFGEAAEQVTKISEVLGILEYFVKNYEINRSKVASFFPPDKVPIMWSFDFEKVFSRFVKFMKRLKMVREMMQTTVEMLKLEKVEFSGIRGKILSTETSLIFERYTTLNQNISQIQYNPLDTEDDTFVTDYNNFMAKVSDIDRRLAKLFGQAFDESPNLESLFKFIQIIGDLAQRPRILLELEPRYNHIVTLLEAELQQVKEIFKEEVKAYHSMKLRPTVDLYFPPVGGMLWTIFKLRKRISCPMTEFSNIENPIVSSPKALEVLESYSELIKRLDEFENNLFTKWVQSVPVICDRCLTKNLVIKDNGLLTLNFDVELVCLLREIRYMLFLEKEGLPAEGIDLFDRNEKIQENISNMNRAIVWYNNIRKGSHESEVALIEREINRIDELLKRGLHELNWNDEITAYVDELFKIINELQLRVLTAQHNTEQTFNYISNWASIPLYDRIKVAKSGKFQLLALDENTSRKDQRTADILTSYNKVQQMIEENYCLFFNIKRKPQKITGTDEESLKEDENEFEEKECAFNEIEPQDGLIEEENQDDEEIEVSEEEKEFRAKHWPSYVQFIDAKVSKSVMEAIATSLKVFIMSMDLERGPNIPFMEVLVELQEPNFIFKPSLEEDVEGSLRGLIVNMLQDIFKQAEIFKRVAKDLDVDDYYSQATNDGTLKSTELIIMETLKFTIEDIQRYIQLYEKYSYLWMDERSEFLNTFLKYGKVLTREALEACDFEETEDVPVTERPSLDIFKEQIDLFETLFSECDKLSVTHLFNGWLQLDMKKLKQALLNLICKWGNMFKQDLVDHVHDSLNDLENFIEQAVSVLSIELSEKDYEGLLRVMACLIKVRERQETSTTQMFGPLSDVIELLKAYGVEFPEESTDQLEVLPEKWKNLIKLASMIKHNVGPLQINHAQTISKQVTQFNHQMQLYWNDFQLKKFFHMDCEDVYDLIDKTHIELMHFEDITLSLSESCELFDISGPDDNSIMGARRELRMAKQLWDYYFLVECTIEDWKKTPWKMIDAESMDMECKRFTKDLRTLDKDMRSWEAYIAIEAVIKNLLTSLRAVTELQNPAIRDRHWIELMQATKKLKRILPKDRPEVITSSQFSHSSSPHFIINSDHPFNNKPSIIPESPNDVKIKDDDMSQIISEKYVLLHKKIKNSKYSLNDFDLDLSESKKITDSSKFIASDKNITQRNIDFPYIFCEYTI